MSNYTIAAQTTVRKVYYFAEMPNDSIGFIVDVGDDNSLHVLIGQPVKKIFGKYIVCLGVNRAWD
jgi:hypothetical protein